MPGRGPNAHLQPTDRRRWPARRLQPSSALEALSAPVSHWLAQASHRLPIDHFVTPASSGR
ncbi:MAG: hypothetical protein DMF90_03805 [Acidobacteria bacterium]|nr:MAG: hypothetical protein DMF90_03805 [Acidobacteriota bacterium]